MFNVSVIVSKAKELGPKPYPVQITSKANGLQLLGALETHLTAQGFDFHDIQGDKNNKSCVSSRQGRLLSMGKHGPSVCIRLFEKADGSYSLFVQAQ